MGLTSEIFVGDTMFGIKLTKQHSEHTELITVEEYHVTQIDTPYQGWSLRNGHQKRNCKMDNVKKNNIISSIIRVFF